MSEDNKTQPDLKALQEENIRLKTLLSQHGIAWDKPVKPTTVPSIKSDIQNQSLSIAEKLVLFQNLFRGRPDIYSLRWVSAKGKSGYAPACGNQWKPGLCDKPHVKCGDCGHRLLLPVTERVIYGHLSGEYTVGVYPLLVDDTCCFFAADFDKGEWRKDASAFERSCHAMDLPAALEISRSGNGAHVWIFFSEPVPAREARRLGAALISLTCDRMRQLSLKSYDRFFPNQDTLPKGGFGNLIALPLQKKPRASGFSVFVDENFKPYPDQWDFLKSIKPISSSGIENAISRATGGGHPLDVAFISKAYDSKPWEGPQQISNQVPDTLPDSLELVLANQIFIAKADLPRSLSNRLIRLAVFQNPKFYKAQAMRLSVWGKPRVISCAENYPLHIALPRGCLDAALELLSQNNIQAIIRDERVEGQQVTVKFIGELRKDQKTAVEVMLKQEEGILCAPTAFGKTVSAAALIAHRELSTMILVHRTDLLRQWRDRLETFLELPAGTLGQIGGGKKKLTGKIDIAVMQSLSRRGDLPQLLDRYGQIIIDECHHVSAFSFENILKQAKSKFVLGLTATPVRRDGHHPIIFMQCGPIRHKASRPDYLVADLSVYPRYLPAPEIPPKAGIQDIFRTLIRNPHRNQRIAHDIIGAYQLDRKVMVLTERTEHLELLRQALADEIDHCFILHGRVPKKKRARRLAELSQLADSIPRVILATGRLIGEGFDHPPLDTLVLAMPISWKGTLRQYVGRLHREHPGKQDIIVFDYVEDEIPQLSRMWIKRQRGYRAMGYQVRS